MMRLEPLKTHSDGTEVAGTARISFAREDWRVRLITFWFALVENSQGKDL
jgi:hypothetical protein